MKLSASIYYHAINVGIIEILAYPKTDAFPFVLSENYGYGHHKRYKYIEFASR